ncbi:MAG TPA: YdeI/OmpD-associated family protein [Mycobacteriales bacterium]|nr:YdeI/OmpD-associated family protein [Mycobacteriales bacterium]
MTVVLELQELLVPGPADWRAWLEEHHARSPGVWLVLGRKGGSLTTMTWATAVDEALCFGWIDGQAAKRDDVSSLQRMTPRRPRSTWSARNVANVARLEQEGRMRPAGRAAVAAAQADGRWDRAYDGPADAHVPDDLAAAIASDPRAQAMFDVLTASNRYALIHRTVTAVKPETRARRIAGFVELLARYEAPFPQKRRPQ